MIHLHVFKFEVTKAEGAVVTLRVGPDSSDQVQEFRLKVASYEMKAWAESVGCSVPLDPKVLANQESVLLDDPDKKGSLVRA